MKRLHVICRNRANLEPLEHPVYASGHWDIPLETARTLIGGMLYLHENKKQPSYFGGLVTDVEPSHLDGVAHTDRVRFIFTASREGRDQAWAGQAHGPAWSSGILDS